MYRAAVGFHSGFLYARRGVGNAEESIETMQASRLSEGAYCDEHKPLHPDRLSAAKRGYSSKWQRVSKAYLRKHQLCVKCMAEGKYVTGNGR